MKKNNVLLFLGIGLVLYGLISSNKLNFSNIVPISPNNNQTIVIEKPNEELQQLVKPVIQSLQDGSSDRSIDGVRLAQLYRDMAILIAVDSEVLQTTDEIREANVLSAKILGIDLKGKYEGLADASNNLFKKYVSEDSVALDNELRKKSSEAFSALAWGFLQGSK